MCGIYLVRVQSIYGVHVLCSIRELSTWHIPQRPPVHCQTNISHLGEPDVSREDGFSTAIFQSRVCATLSPGLPALGFRRFEVSETRPYSKDGDPTVLFLGGEYRAPYASAPQGCSSPPKLVETQGS